MTIFLDFANARLPLEKYPFCEMGTSMDVRFGRGRRDRGSYIEVSAVT